MNIADIDLSRNDYFFEVGATSKYEGGWSVFFRTRYEAKAIEIQQAAIELQSITPQISDFIGVTSDKENELMLKEQELVDEFRFRYKVSTYCPWAMSRETNEISIKKVFLNDFIN